MNPAFKGVAVTDRSKIVSDEEAVCLIRDGDTVVNRFPFRGRHEA